MPRFVIRGVDVFLVGAIQNQQRLGRHRSMQGTHLRPAQIRACRVLGIGQINDLCVLGHRTDHARDRWPKVVVRSADHFSADGIGIIGRLEIAIRAAQQRLATAQITTRQTLKKIVRTLTAGDLDFGQPITLGNRRCQYRVNILNVAFHRHRSRASRGDGMGRRSKSAFIGIQKYRCRRHRLTTLAHHVWFDVFDTRMGAGNSHKASSSQARTIPRSADFINSPADYSC